MGAQNLILCLSQQIGKAKKYDLKSLRNVVEPQTVPDFPKVPLSDYATAIILGLMTGFGGFVFGWDTGAIFGVVNLANFIKRFCFKNERVYYYLFKVRTGLIVSILN